MDDHDKVDQVEGGDKTRGILGAGMFVGDDGDGDGDGGDKT